MIVLIQTVMRMNASAILGASSVKQILFMGNTYISLLPSFQSTCRQQCPQL